MKIPSKYFLISFIFAVILIIAVVFGYQYQTIQAQSAEYKLAGWLYTENYGFISLNFENITAVNCTFPECTDDEGVYYVSLNSANEIKGYGWSSNVGWICFGDGGGDATKGCVGSPPRGTLTTTLDPDTGVMTGWARVNSLGDNGWIELRSQSNASAAFGQQCYGCEEACKTWTVVCDEEQPPNCVEQAPCLEYYADRYETCQFCFTKTFYGGQNLPNPPGDEAVVGGSGPVCSDCTGSGTGDPITGDYYCKGDVSTRITCSDCPTTAGKCKDYGVFSNLDDGSLVGWAWNGTSDGLTGAGWIHFNTLGSAGIVYPWLETQYGSIYTSKSFRQRAGIKVDNATYCIFADSIQHVRSDVCDLNVVGGIEIEFPSRPESAPNYEVYSNALGKIDLKGLENIINPLAGIKRNKFGHQVVATDQDGFFSDLSASGNVLNNKVYIINSDLTVNNPLQFNSGSPRGNGTIIVKGDLFINNIIKYNGGVPPADLRQVSSVAWVVQGDVVVDPSVENIVGAYIVLGDGVSTLSCNANCADFPEYDQNGAGVFFSGTLGTELDQSLTVAGMIVAQAFDFRRKFADVSEGSERIIYDGRLIANPPPGMKSFTEGLPVVRDFPF